jgi:hypothetical protein
MPSDHLTNRNHPPSIEEIQLALSSRYSLWKRLTQFIDSKDQTSCEWSTWGPAEFGWGLRYRRKGKALIGLYPQQKFFIAQVVLGRTQAEQALKLNLGERVRIMLREAPQLRDGRWLSIPIMDEEDVKDVEQLMQVKIGS